MHPVADLIGVAEAHARIQAAFDPVTRTERVPLEDAAGRVLANDVTAPRDVPAAARSSMDGYAVRAKDLTEPGARLRLDGVVHAGDDASGVLVADGGCVQIATGATLPQGADAVVPVELTLRDGDTVSFEATAALGQFVTPRGADIHAGRTVLTAGLRLTPARLAVAAAVGTETLDVYDRPRVRVVATGNEVRPVGATLAPGQVYESNVFGVAAMLESWGAEPVRGGVLEDTPEAWTRLFESAGDVDALVVTGGSSAGERDLAARVLARVGAVGFHGVRVKPGKPLLVGTVGSTPVVVLPGFPASCLVDAVVFLGPAVRRMSRVGEPPHARIPARMASLVRSPPDKHQIVPVRIEDGLAHPTFRESGATTSLSDAVGYVEIPEGATVLEEGTPVAVRPFA
jgi:molybdenum cofactor synthesis domain-containing protein